MWYCHKDRHTGQWNKGESRKISEYLQSVDFQQKCKGNSMGQKIVLSANNAITTQYHYEKNELWPLYHIILKIKSKCITFLSRKANILNF